MARLSRCRCPPRSTRRRLHKSTAQWAARPCAARSRAARATARSGRSATSGRRPRPPPRASWPTSMRTAAARSTLRSSRARRAAPTASSRWPRSIRARAASSALATCGMALSRRWSSSLSSRLWSRLPRRGRTRRTRRRCRRSRPPSRPTERRRRERSAEPLAAGWGRALRRRMRYAGARPYCTRAWVAQGAWIPPFGGDGER
mmetsp:Transcript_3288/g.8527  ORF Transcript_3288/g.8527 Transcript_3288/m.8527 type:complete len:203 (+) Transcript_3288:1284-1892(+)